MLLDSGDEGNICGKRCLLYFGWRHRDVGSTCKTTMYNGLKATRETVQTFHWYDVSRSQCIACLREQTRYPVEKTRSNNHEITLNIHFPKYLVVPFSTIVSRSTNVHRTFF